MNDELNRAKRILIDTFDKHSQRANAKTLKSLEIIIGKIEQLQYKLSKETRNKKL